MPLVLAGLFGKGLGVEYAESFGSYRKHRMIWYFPSSVRNLDYSGAMCLILLFILMLWRFMVIANNAKDLYGALLVVGIMASIAIQVILNIAVVTNSIPITGITLPFISYGGTSVLFLLAEMGLALVFPEEFSWRDRYMIREERRKKRRRKHILIGFLTTLLIWHWQHLL